MVGQNGVIECGYTFWTEVVALKGKKTFFNFKKKRGGEAFYRESFDVKLNRIRNLARGRQAYDSLVVSSNPNAL